MALGYLLEPFIQVNTIVGTPVVGAKIYVYKANTTNLAVTYNDFQGHMNTNPVRTNTLGNCTIIAEDNTTYDIEIRDALNILLMSKKNVSIVGTSGQSSDISVDAGYGITVTRSRNVFTVAVDTDIIATQDDLNDKQDKLVAGDNISLDNNTVSVVNRRELVTEYPIKLERGNNRVKVYLDDDYGNQFKPKQHEVNFGGGTNEVITYIAQDENGEIDATVETLSIPDQRRIDAGTGISISEGESTDTIAVDTDVVATKNQFHPGLNTVITTANNSIIIDTKTDANSLNYGAYCFVLGQNNELGGANTLLGGKNSTNMGISNLMMGDSLYAAANSENNILVGNDVRCQGQYGNCNIGVGYNVQYAGSRQKGNAMFGITQNLYGVSAEGNAIFGYNDTVYGNYNMVGGEHNTVTANNTVIWGKDNTVNGVAADKDNNFIIGRSNTISGNSYDRDNGILGKSNTIRIGGGSENFIYGLSNSFSGAGYFNYNVALGYQNTLECSANSTYDNVLIGASNKIYGKGWANGLFGYDNKTNAESNTYIVGYDNEIKGPNVLYAGIYGNENNIETKEATDGNRLQYVGILGSNNDLKYTTAIPSDGYLKEYIIGADNAFTNPGNYNVAIGKGITVNGKTYSFTYGYSLSADSNTTKIGYDKNYIKIDGTNAYKVINGTSGVIATTNDLATYLPTSTFNTYSAAHASDDVTPYTAGAGIDITNHVISTTDSKYKPVAAGTLDSDLARSVYVKSIVNYDRFSITLQNENNTFRVFIYNHADSNRPLIVYVNGTRFGYVQQNATTKIYETTYPDYLLLNIQLVGYGIGNDIPMYEYNLIQKGSQYSVYKVHEYDV